MHLDVKKIFHSLALITLVAEPELSYSGACELAKKTRKRMKIERGLANINNYTYEHIGVNFYCYTLIHMYMASLQVISHEKSDFANFAK